MAQTVSVKRVILSRINVSCIYHCSCGHSLACREKRDSWTVSISSSVLAKNLSALESEASVQVP